MRHMISHILNEGVALLLVLVRAAETPAGPKLRLLDRR